MILFAALAIAITLTAIINGLMEGFGSVWIENSLFLAAPFLVLLITGLMFLGRGKRRLLLGSMTGGVICGLIAVYLVLGPAHRVTLFQPILGPFIAWFCIGSGSLLGSLIGAAVGACFRPLHEGRCPSCGYDRAGLAEGAACPECGS